MAKSLYRAAVGLAYSEEADEVPSVAFKADNEGADRVVKMAERFGVPVVCRQELARGLGSLEVGQDIPEVLFEAVAVVIAEIERRGQKV